MKKLLFLLSSFTFLNLIGQPAGWLYNQPITVTNSNNVAAVNYQLKLTVNTQTLISAGQMNPSGSDIRFGATCTGTAFFNYWIEGGMNTPTTAIWVKIPHVAANTFTTIFMFYGNNTAPAVSNVLGTFRGPSSSHDSVVTTGVTNLGGNQRGFRFSPNENMLITHFGKYTPNASTQYVTLFNFSNQAIVSQTQVAGPATTYSYTAINPIWLTANTQYVLEVFQNSNDGYYFGTSSQIGQHLTYYDMRYCNSCTQNTFPTNVLNNYHYGIPDFWYFLTTTLTIPPTYTLGGSSVTITGPSAICSGNSATLVTNASGTFSWNTGQNTNTIVVSPTVMTTYQVSETNTIGCNSNGYHTVNINTQVPTLTVVNTASSTGGICPNKTVTLTASGATTYTWTNGVQNGVSFGPQITNTYVVTGENACGTTSAATSISVHPNPTITAAPTQPSVCTQQSVAICANGGLNYTIAPTQQNCTGFFPFATQTYTVVGDNSLGCRDTVTTTIQVVTTPATAPVASHSLICIGSSATLAALGATDYTWTPGAFSTSAIVISPNVTTTYTVTKRNANCYDTKTISLIVNPLPTAFAVAQPTAVCAGTSATLSGCCGNSYTWSPGNLPSGPNAANITVYPQTDTDYTMAVSDGTCMNTSTLTLATYTNPIISVTTNTDYLCAGQTVNFNISGADNYTFTNNPSTSPPLTGATAAVQLTTTTNYMITGSNSSSCTSSAQKVIVVYPLPNFALSSTPGLVCVGGAANLSAASSATSPAHQYVWAHNQQTGSSTVVNPMTTTTYSATGTNTVTGCVSDKTVSVAVFEPTFTTTSDTAICNKGSVNLIASGATSFTWTGGQPGIHFITVSPSVTTIYSVTALSQTVNGLKCLSTQTVEVSIYNNPTITASYQRSVVCRGESVDLYAKGADTYTWTNAGNKNGDTISVSPLNKTTYIVIGTDLFGCRDTSNVTVEFSNCTGLAEHLGGLNVSIFPNPSSGVFTIQGARDMDLELLNELGQVIRVVRLTSSNQHTVNVAGVAAGVYFLRGKQQETVVTEKVVVQR